MHRGAVWASEAAQAAHVVRIIFVSLGVIGEMKVAIESTALPSVLQAAS